MCVEIHRLKDGRAISFCDLGKKDGTALLQFHGTPGSRITGLSDPEVAEAGYRSVSPDRPGYGYSTPHPQGDFESWADDIHQLVDQLGIRQFHVIGISGGGPFALACAAYLQKYVLSATLMSTTTPTENAAFWQGMQFANKILFLAAIKLPLVLRMLCYAYGRLGRWSAARRGSEPSHEGETFRQGGIGLETDLRLVSHPWNIPLGRIKAPVFLWHGENDVHSPAAGAKVLASQIRTCESYFLPDQDHFLHRNPEINQKIEDRIRSISRPDMALN